MKMSVKTILMLAVSLLALGCAATAPAPEDVLLEKDWKICPASVAGDDGCALASACASDVGWYEAEVPSTVLGTLVSNGFYEDAFTGCNYDKVIDRSLFDEPWWYKVDFNLPARLLEKHVFLNFDGISYSAEVWLNGVRLASRDEMKCPFRQFSFDVSDIVRERNTLAVKLFRAEDGDFNIGFVDWNPRPADESMGIFRPVRLSFCDDVLLRNTAVRAQLDTVTYDDARLTVETVVENLSDRTVDGYVCGKFEGGSFRYGVSLAPFEKKTVAVTSEEARCLQVKNPRLWWSHDLGTPGMYGMDVSFEYDGRISDAGHVDFGIRDLRSYFTAEGHQGFILNGKKVLVRGAGWTDDIFLRNPHQRNDIETDYVKDMNLNAIRFENFWGTSQDIYDLCDRKGLLALAGWSCFWEWEVYTGVPDDDYGCIKTPEDMDMMAESLRDQVLWLRNHPSIIAWFVGSDKLPRPELEQRYIDMLAGVDDRPVVMAAKALTSSVSGPTGMKMAGPYDWQSPVYWYCDEAPGGAFGFNTETGIGAQLPLKESLQKMIPSGELFPPGKAYDYHCTIAGEAMHSLDVLKDVIAERYGRTENIDDFLLRAHHLDYDGTRAMFEAFRVNAGKSTGIIQWMLNSAWPSLYWQLYDWYLVPCAGYWGTKKANAQRQLVYDYADRTVYAVNSSATDTGIAAEMKLYDLQGRLVLSESAGVTVPERGSVPVFTLPGFAGDVAFLFLRLCDTSGKELADNVYCLSAVDDVHCWEKYNWIRTPLLQSADYTALDGLAEAEIIAEVSPCGDGVTVGLENRSSSVAFFICMNLKDPEGEIVVPAIWSDNFVSLAPGEKRSFSCRGAGVTEAVSLEISGWNVPLTVLDI